MLEIMYSAFDGVVISFIPKYLKEKFVPPIPLKYEDHYRRVKLFIVMSIMNCAFAGPFLLHWLDILSPSFVQYISYHNFAILLLSFPMAFFINLLSFKMGFVGLTFAVAFANLSLLFNLSMLCLFTGGIMSPVVSPLTTFVLSSGFCTGKSWGGIMAILILGILAFFNNIKDKGIVDNHLPPELAANIWYMERNAAVVMTILYVYFYESIMSGNTVRLLEENNKVEIANKAKSAFLACISHEMRTPLTHVMMVNQLLIDTGNKQLKKLLKEEGKRMPMEDDKMATESTATTALTTPSTPNISKPENTGNCHEDDESLRNPRNANNVSKQKFSHKISTLSQTQLEAVEQTKEALRLLKTSSASSMTLYDLICDVLDMSKIDAGKMTYDMELVELLPICSSVISMFEHTAEEKKLDLKLICTNAPKNLCLFVDSLRLKQVLINLVGNAVKFTPEGFVSLIIDYDEKKSKCKITVEDSGIGIEENKLKKLFEPFTQAEGAYTTRKFGGSGLGLAISVQLVRSMNGNIVVESTPNLGSMFHVEFAASNEKKDNKNNEPTPTEFEANDPTSKIKKKSLRKTEKLKDLLRGFNILVCDDNVVTCELVSLIIKNLGGNVDVVNSGNDAVAKFNENPHYYDLWLLDLCMPGMDGFEVTKHIRNGERLLRDKKPLYISAFTAVANKTETQIKCLKEGMDAFVSKPFNRKEFIDFLNNSFLVKMKTYSKQQLSPERAGPIKERKEKKKKGR